MPTLTKKKPKKKIVKPVSVKARAKKIVDRLPEAATWDDLQDSILFQQSLERALEDSRNGRVTPHEEIEKEMGLDS